MTQPRKLTLLTLGRRPARFTPNGGIVRNEFRHAGATLHYRQALIDAADLDRFRVSESARSALCEPCPVHLRCWSCPGQNDGFDGYTERPYSRCLLYLFWIDLNASAVEADPFGGVIAAYGTIASYATHFGRMMEARLGGKEMIDGRCAVCRVCTAAESPPRPCVYPTNQRSSLEALGINVIRLTREVFDHPLHWYRQGGATPPYVSVVHGLFTESEPPIEMIFEPEIGGRAVEWMERWAQHLTTDDEIGPR